MVYFNFNRSGIVGCVLHIYGFVTLLYEYAWVILVVIAVIILIRFIVRPDFRNKVFTLIIGRKHRKSKSLDTAETYVAPKVTKDVDALKAMVDVAVSDGEISETEKRSTPEKVWRWESFSVKWNLSRMKSS